MLIYYCVSTAVCVGHTANRCSMAIVGSRLGSERQIYRALKQTEERAGNPRV